jgi:predicted ribosome quality control (RQC) complex YloA/Tae2 family protein
MPRLLGVEIPAKKKVGYSLRYIYGIGPLRADQIIKEAGIDPNLRAQDLTEENLNKILHIITDHKWVLEGDLRRELGGQFEAAPGDQLLSGDTSSSQPPCARSAHEYQRPYPQGTAQDRWCNQS